ncbi:MAG: TetR/AcrR family transcriptional regulator [Pseudomonadota bacterium]
MTTQQTDQPHESRRKLLDAALQVIRSRGYAGTRVDDVCAAAGLTKGSFFHHFDSKEELAIAAAAHFSAKADARFAQAPYQQAQDPVDRVLGYVDFRSAIATGDLAQVSCLLGTMVQEAYRTHPAIREACEAHIGDHAATVAQDIEAAQAQNVPDAPWRSDSMALFTQAVLQGAFVLAKAKQDPAVVADCLAHLRRYLAHELRPRATAD